MKGGAYVNGKALDWKEAENILHKNGFFRHRTNGSHAIYKDDLGRTVTITVGKPLSQKTWKRECKKNGIREDI